MTGFDRDLLLTLTLTPGVALARTLTPSVGRYRHTLLPRYLGFHRLQIPDIGKVHFVVFANVFSTDRVIHERYDLKGSTLGRTVGAETLARKADCVRKDLDLKRQFNLGSNRDAIVAQIRADMAPDRS